MQCPRDSPFKPAASPAVADPLVSVLHHVRRCITELNSSCSCCDDGEQQRKQMQQRGRVGCHCTTKQQQVLRDRMRSTLSLLKLLLQVDMLGHKLRQQIWQHLPSVADVATTVGISLEERHEELRAAGFLSEGQVIFILKFSRCALFSSCVRWVMRSKHHPTSAFSGLFGCVHKAPLLALSVGSSSVAATGGPATAAAG